MLLRLDLGFYVAEVKLLAQEIQEMVNNINKYKNESKIQGNCEVHVKRNFEHRVKAFYYIYEETCESCCD